MIQEARRGPAAYHPPYGNPAFGPLFASQHPRMPFPRHAWAAACAAYAFRLKPDVMTQLTARMQESWPQTAISEESSPEAAAAGGSESSMQPRRRPGPVWGMHVRHGDVSALADVYRNRRVFSFPQFFEAVRHKAQQALTAGKTLPTALFVASDDVDTEAIMQEQRTLLASSWPGISSHPPPLVFTLGASLQRYRTPHGSHTVAADGGCVSDTCALHAHDIIAYTAAPQQREAPRHQRIMRVLAESIEDLFQLAHSDVLVAQGSSHFSTLAALLMWARTGAADPLERVIYLDQELIEEGIVQSSLLHGSLNGTSAIAPGRGWERWHSHTRRFLEGITPPQIDAEAGGGDVDPFPPATSSSASAYRLHMEEGLPLFPSDVFYREALRWTGHSVAAADALSIWPGECPLLFPSSSSSTVVGYLKQAIMQNINHGADHSDPHPGQAMRCWGHAQWLMAQLSSAPASASAEVASPPSLADLEDVLTGNMAALRTSDCFPYSMTPRQVARFLRINVGPQHPGADNNNNNNNGAEAAPVKKKAKKKR